MSNKKRLIEFVLHGKPDKFKTVLKEEITNRAVDFLYNKTFLERQNIFNNIKPVKEELVTESVKNDDIPFYPETSYQLKDGNLGILDFEDRNNISKLYENLNNDNRKRMLKLLSESQETFNRIVKLAKIENKKDSL